MASHTTINAESICANNIKAGTISGRKKIRNLISADMIIEGVFAVEYLSVADSGAIFNITESTDKSILIILPTASTDAEALQLVGWYATFIIGAVGDQSVTIGPVGGGSNTLVGSIATHGQDALTSVIIADNTVKFGSSTNDCVVGDSVDIFCIASTASAATYLARGFANT